ncbi:hypothetical protein PSACC_03416 [Paramicrosporidium saccamoebae]|uniref:Uncharacterized protein n=1 Tax=Paramicrosporidium saccamoebae TaxID=1246581 RepID=A0A2H9TGH5_9FUNG|nr:hypothetical protein PSACC_03416 [Paramicrosporidium saccamoebae]
MTVEQEYSKTLEAQLAELERQRTALQKELGKTCDILKMDESEAEGLGEIISEQVKAGWGCRYSTEGDMSEKLSVIQGVLVKRLEAVLRTHKLSDNADETMGQAFDLLLLFKSIDQQHEGLEILSNLVQKFTANALGTILNQQSSLDFRFALRTGKICEFAKGLFGWCRGQLLRLDENGSSAAIHSRIFTEAEIALVSVIRSFISERNVHQMVESLQIDDSTTSEMNIKDMDLLATEIALIIQNCLSLARDRQHAVRNLDATKFSNLGSLFSVLADLLISYSKLENAYLQSGVRMVLILP